MHGVYSNLEVSMRLVSRVSLPVSLLRSLLSDHSPSRLFTRLETPRLNIARWLRQTHKIILKLSDHHVILLTFYVVNQASYFLPVEPKLIHNLNRTYNRVSVMI